MSMHTISRLIGVGLVIVGAASAAAEVQADLTVAGVFGDRMVVQRDQPLRVWGKAAAGETVTVEFAGQTKSAPANAEGRWAVTLDPVPVNAAGQSFTVRVGDAKPGPNRRVFNDVLVGDVWLLAGGGDVARMVMQLANPDAAASEFTPTAFALARACMLASKTAKEPAEDVKGSWTAVGAGDPKRLPATAMHLAKALSDALGASGGTNIPVGVIVASNDKPAECWMSPESLAASPAAKPILEFYASDAWKTVSTGTYEDRMKAWLEYNQKLPLNPLPKPKPDDATTLPQQEPSSVWNGMVAPLLPVALRGIVWEDSDDWATQSRAIQQGQLLAALIPAWRAAFHDAALPFVIVQLPPHHYARGIGGIGIDGRLAAELRDGQIEAAKAAKATLVTTIDLPANPPPDVMAHRIAATITAQAFGKESGDGSGPKLVSTETIGNKVVLTFTDTKGGLTAKGKNLQGFAIAASPMRWVWADATIDGDTVTVSSPAVPRPEGVRYAYEDAPSRGATLCDGRGNPADPFRTDTHPSLTAAHVTPAAPVLRFSRRTNPAIEDGSLPRVLIIGDSISGHYLERLRILMESKANIVGEASMDPKKNSWSAVGAHFYRTDTATKGDDLKTFLAESGPWDIVHFNIGIHMFAGAKPGDEKPYAEKLRQVVQTIRDSGAICLFANSTGTVADNTLPRFPNYLTNCQAFNAAAEEVMREMGVPVTDIYGMIQPRIKELISGDLIHTTAEADQMMAELIAKRLTETIATLRAKPLAEPTNATEAAAKKQAVEAAIDEQYAALVATLSPDEQAWEQVLQEQLGSFYLPLHKRDKVAGHSNAWDFVKDDPALPRVLLIGDSVSRGYTQPVRKALAGKANVYRAPANCGPTASGIRSIDAWLASAPGGDEWDVIHFNFGIHDRNTPVADYTDRLEQLVERMKKTGATLIWASTTPIPDNPAAKQSAASIVERNTAAAAIMGGHGVAIDDLFAFITPHLAAVQPPNDVHFTNDGYELLGQQVADSIMAAVKER